MSAAGALPPAGDILQAFFEQYRCAFDALDGDAVAALYAEPSGIAQGGVYTHWPAREAVRTNMRALCELYMDDPLEHRCGTLVVRHQLQPDPQRRGLACAAVHGLRRRRTARPLNPYPQADDGARPQRQPDPRRSPRRRGSDAGDLHAFGRSKGDLLRDRRVGFEPVGVLPRAGRKFGAWRDVAWFHRKLRDEPLAP